MTLAWPLLFRYVHGGIEPQMGHEEVKDEVEILGKGAKDGGVAQGRGPQAAQAKGHTRAGGETSRGGAGQESRLGLAAQKRGPAQGGRQGLLGRSGF